MPVVSKTFQLRPSGIERNWHLMDASQLTLGRLSSLAANHLIGKDKATYTPHIDGGDYVVVINASHLQYTGQTAAKNYYRHSGYPGNLRTTSLKQLFSKEPADIVRRAVRGMLPKNKLQPVRLARLYVYNDSQHPHAGQLSNQKTSGDSKS